MAWTPVTLQRHATCSWRRFTSFSFAARQGTAPLVAAEIAAALLALPLAFEPFGAQGQERRYRLVALLALQPEQNAFVTTTGQWRGGYVPSAFRSYPFGLLRLQGVDQPVLAVAEDSGLLLPQRGAGEAFFTAEGELAPAVVDVLKFLRQVEENRCQTQAAVDALARSGVLVPWVLPAVAEAADGAARQDLFRVDAERLNTLDDAAFLQLRRCGALAIAWGQLYSMGMVSVVRRLSRPLDPSAGEERKTAQFDKDDLFHF
ncbi:SapC family protein [Desulfuromonas thiophila]|uniref:SapC protein n=1 Tax=Desulfuromonas thiophila TaxID=57664 RepID=A0A1G7EX88_9BACT|nr:SapC family protein [Desulfuromonas thiophila]SDE67995.1 SapC protein [Desulfuromonas thiophila]